MAAGLTATEARQLLAAEAPLNGQAFKVLGTIARLAAESTSVGESRDLLIRLLERRASLDEYDTEILDSLSSRLGLFPYVSSPQALSGASQIAYEFHRPESLEHENFVFHAMQREIYQRLLDGANIVLSAPTSFGKSAITDALVASEQWSQIAIVVPTLALIDETRRRMSRFSDRYKINTFPGQAVATKTVFVMTQERLLEVEPFPPVDLFVLDEFYKLDTTTDAERSSLLNIAWDRLRRTGAQYYLTGPNVTSLAEALPNELRESLIVTDFRTVAADEIAVPPGKDEGARLLEVCAEITGPSLVYCRTPKRVREIAQLLLDGDVSEPSHQSQMAANWVYSNYDPEWIVGKCLDRGIGVHHARVPRAMQHHIVRLFNSGALKYLICTSTLIEGVNTAAENVLVVDNILNRQQLDYFTFSNIRGRAGRMFRHFVGRVYLFDAGPEPTQTTIDIPISSQSPRATTAVLLQLPEDELTDDARERLRPYFEQDTLDVEVLRRNKGIDPDRQLAVADTIQQNLRSLAPALDWTNVPTFDQVEAMSKLMLDHLVPPGQRGRVTARSLATRLNVVRRAGGSVPTMVAGQLPYSENRDEAVEDVLAFNRNWMGHMFPSYLMAIGRIQADVLGRHDLHPGSYAFYAREVENQFLPPFFVTLEEYGLPVPVSLKLRGFGLYGESLDEILKRLRVVAANPAVIEVLDPFEQDMLDEVVTGLGPSAVLQ